MSSAANEATQQIIAAFARRRPDWRVDMRQAGWSDASAGLASGDADVGLLRLPFPGPEKVRIEMLHCCSVRTPPSADNAVILLNAT